MLKCPWENLSNMIKNKDIINYVILSVIVLIGLGFGNCSTDAGGNIENDRDYRLLISNMPMDLYDDSDIKIGGGSWGGNVVVKINNNPVNMGEFGGKIFKISHWVKNGKNILSFSGIISENLYYKLLMFKVNNKVAKVISADKVTPEEINHHTKEFNIVTNYQSKFYFKKINKNAKNEERLIKKILLIRELLIKGEESAFINIISKGPRVWADNLKENNLIENKIRGLREQYFLEKNIMIVPIEPNEFKIIWGDQSVIVLSGYRKIWDDFKKPYLYKITNKDGQIKHFPPLYMVYLDDEWVVWQ